MSLRLTEGRPFRWLDFDCESRPLTFQGDWNTSEITAIAASWTDARQVRCWVLGEVEPEEMLTAFRELWDEADGVTGHNIRRFDCPLVNGALLEFGLPTLTPKLTCDTYADLLKRRDLSASQESLGQMFGTSHPKEHMSQPQWREANRLTPAGLKETKRRVRGDVRQHKALREHLLSIGALRAPSVWRP